MQLLPFAYVLKKKTFDPKKSRPLGPHFASPSACAAPSLWVWNPSPRCAVPNTRPQHGWPHGAVGWAFLLGVGLLILEMM